MASNRTDLPLVEIPHLEQLWFQVAGTRCNLACTHCFISCSPHNRTFGLMTLEQVRARLEESVALGTREYYFTGGEPFLNPGMTAMLVAALEYGPATVLTNGTVLREEWLKILRDAEQATDYSLEFRVSIDGFTASANDAIRGSGSLERAMRGVRLLTEFGFLPIITVVRLRESGPDREILDGFRELLAAAGCTRPRIKILPTLQMGAEASRTSGYTLDDRITPDMLRDYDTSQLVCQYSRIATDRGIHVCPILIEHHESLLADSLADSMRPFAVVHGPCSTCYQYGAICSNPSQSLRDSGDGKQLRRGGRG